MKKDGTARASRTCTRDNDQLYSKEVIPTIKCVNSRFKYEKLSHSVNQFTFVVKVHSFLKKYISHDYKYEW